MGLSTAICWKIVLSFGFWFACVPPVVKSIYKKSKYPSLDRSVSWMFKFSKACSSIGAFALAVVL